jgi:hypothetical protein
MISRSLVRRELHTQGILYQAEELAGAFFDNMRSLYIVELRDRAAWVATTFDELEPNALDAMVNRLFEAWTTEFQPVQLATQGDLFS